MKSFQRNVKRVSCSGRQVCCGTDVQLWVWTAAVGSLLGISALLHARCGPGSSVGIATGYGLDGPGIESRWGARFSAPVHTGPGAHPAFCTMGTGGKERPGRDIDPSPPSNAEVMKEQTYTSTPLWAVRPVRSLSACTRVHFTFLHARSFLYRTDESSPAFTPVNIGFSRRLMKNLTDT